MQGERGLGEAQAEAHGAFLARQEGVQELTLNSDPDDDVGTEASINRILQLGGAISRRLTVLHLLTPILTAVSGEAIRRCCPALRTVHIFGLHDVEEAFFSPLRECQALTKVSLGHGAGELWCGDCGRILAPLPSLTALTLSGDMSEENFAQLTALSGLEDLDIALVRFHERLRWDGPGVGAVLSTMTRLTCLEGPQMNADTLAAQPGGLPRLASLSLSDAAWPRAHAVVRDAGLAALGRLTALTRLSLPSLSLQPGAAGTGHLPHLRQLHIKSIVGVSDGLAAMLQPLQPLPQLRNISVKVILDQPPAGAAGVRVPEHDSDSDDGQDPAAVAAAAGESMWRAAALLARAPHLQSVDLSLSCQRPAQRRRWPRPPPCHCWCRCTSGSPSCACMACPPAPWRRCGPPSAWPPALSTLRYIAAGCRTACCCGRWGRACRHCGASRSLTAPASRGTAPSRWRRCAVRSCTLCGARRSVLSSAGRSERLLGVG